MTGQHLLENVLVFARTLRAAGLAVPANATSDAYRALEVTGVERRNDVRDALRAVLVSRREDVRAFDRLFLQFWRAWPSRDATLPRPLNRPRRATMKTRWMTTAGVPGRVDDEGRIEPEDARDVPVRSYSPAEVWRLKDFAEYDPADVSRARAAIDRLPWAAGDRITRRWEAGSGTAIDQRRLLRVNMRHAGEPIVIPRRRRRIAARPLVLLCDVSGSMEPYIRMLLLFIHALAYRRRSIELFLFSTRLTRVTREFVNRPIADALARVRETARDWSGGTRIGEALRAFNLEWARRVLRGGPTVLLISDGWDLGDPDLLTAEIARVQRGSFRLIWLNPLIGSPGYAPLTRGMRAALPFVDDFLSVRNMTSLDELASHLGMLPHGVRSRFSNPASKMRPD
jgi:uncharacterized protein with von Willebrand factor type A (vWA) domain